MHVVGLDTSFEQPYWRNSQVVIGVDEVGRGPLAGPVVAAAVVFDYNHAPLAGIMDSKKTKPDKRRLIAHHIRQQALGYGIGVGSVEMINTEGIVPALQFAMNQAIQQVQTALGDYSRQLLIIDGLAFKNTVYPWQPQATYLPKADALVYSVAAASIIAKDFRDGLMTELATQWPEYKWENNAGYGTKEHCRAIQEHGLCAHHRHLFCAKYV